METIHLNFSPESLTILNICIGFVMFGVALDLSVGDFRRLLDNPKASIAGVLSQFVALPALTFLIVLLWKPETSMALGMILVAACPGGNVSNFICHFAKGNAALSVTLTAISTVLAIVLTPLNFGFWSSLLPGIDGEQQIAISAWEMFQSILVIILIPLVLGMGFNHFFPRFTAKLRKPISILSMIIFLGFIVMAFVKNADVFVEYFEVVMILVLVHNALALATGYSIATLFALAPRERRTIALETGIQNSGLGLVLIFTFFGGSGGMALIAAWWGIWHIISGFIMALLWRRQHTS
ncbi:bile acid:sodium symporter family protein [soil metagenome]